MVKSEVIFLDTERRIQVIDITQQVHDIVKKSGITNGTCLINSLHTTLGICIQEAEPLLMQDMEKYLAEMIKEKPGEEYLHDCMHLRGCTAPDESKNAAAHLKNLLIGQSQTLPILGGELEMGQWQAVLACDLDGPRKERRISVMTSGDVGPKTKLEAYFIEVRPLLVERLDKLFPSEEFGKFKDQIKQYLAGGKCLRGCLTTMVCEALGGERDNGLDYGACVEALHASTLLHDGVIDEHTERRGKADMWIPSGVKRTVAMGDRLFALVKKRFLMKGTDAAKVYVDTLDIITSGVISELDPAEFVFDLLRRRVSKKLYLKIIRAKTAALFAGACKEGAIAAGKKELEDELGEYGMEMGTAFQLCDDICDLVKIQSGKEEFKLGSFGTMIPMFLHYDALSVKEAIIAWKGGDLGDYIDRIDIDKLMTDAKAETKKYLGRSLRAIDGVQFKEDFREMLEDFPKYAVAAILAEENLSLE